MEIYFDIFFYIFILSILFFAYLKFLRVDRSNLKINKMSFKYKDGDKYIDIVIRNIYLIDKDDIKILDTDFFKFSNLELCVDGIKFKGNDILKENEFLCNVHSIVVGIINTHETGDLDSYGIVDLNIEYDL
jgi:hypothetical protein